MLKKYIIAILIIIVLNFIAFSGEFNKKSNAKILLIGMDGLEWSIIKKLNKENKMPTFAKLMRNGAYGDLHTYIEYASPSLWTTIATGKKPEVHGITQYILHEKGIYEPISPMSYHRKVKAIWNILTDQGRRTGVINYQCTKPPEVINGFMIPPDNVINGFMIPPEKTDIYPDYLARDINSVVEKDFETTEGFLKFAYYKDDTNLSDKISSISKEITQLSIVTPYLYQRFDKHLDLLMLYLYGTDSISHVFWKFMEPDFFQDKAYGLNSNNIGKYGNVINETYQMVDKFVGKIIEDIVDKNTIVIICSDHGFQRGSSSPMVFLSNLNKILNKIGVLYFKNNSHLLPKASENEMFEVDFSKSQAYHSEVDKAHNALFISINLKGRESHAIVKNGKEFLRLKKHIINSLSNLRILETGKKIFDRVSESSLPQGDIQVVTKNNINLLNQHIKINNNVYPLKEFYTFLDLSGNHDDPGVIIIYGKNIKAEKINGDAHILDITPTILYLLGLPVAKDMEGKVLTEAIKEDFLKAHPIRYISSYEPIGVKREWPNEALHSESIGSKQLERLKSLGYVQ